MRSLQKFSLHFVTHLHHFSSLRYPRLSPTSSCNKTIKLTEEELNRINLLIPRLCLSNNLPQAISLVHTALLTNPPPTSISLSILVHSLSSDPDLTRPISFMTRIKHTNPTFLPTISRMFLSSYFKKGQPRNAMKVFKWMTRPDCPDPDHRFYAVAAGGFCRSGALLESLRAIRLLVGSGFVPGPDLRTQVYGALLRVAMIKEAQELSEAFSGCTRNGGGGKKVVSLLDNMIACWVE
ncbi:hypothetical protein DCAR_0208772 [Daucus carota subsp. sativus]|uniref:Pentatricopeptide repeat-containing protein n=1 Tax=Daucus carota subsp. sativus TaxID=79200 RepID=A0A166ESY5_DAUCS|nr:hypothetical protein DCAR_0208772 [Daucus carota subsp. sativus]